MQTRLFLLTPPPGVSIEDFDRWYLGVHAREAAARPNVARYVSYLGEKLPPELRDQRFDRMHRWHRLTEWSAIPGAGLAGSNFPPYSPPDYPQRLEAPLSGAPDWWLEATVLIGDKPEYDLLREIPKLD